MAERQRVQKVLSQAGIASRRAIDDLVAAGRVTVNGRAARPGEKIDRDKDKVEVDGSAVPLRAELMYLLVNKPEGVVTTADDPQGRPTVVDLVDAPVRLWPVGRLDIDTEGALLLTNDGELTLRLTHPRYHIAKTYLAEVRGRVRPRALRALARGIELDDGPTAPAKARLVERKADSSLVEVTVTEGRPRQVRRMLEAVGHPVVRLARTSIGPIPLGRLKPGTARKLSPSEIQTLYRACGL